jgi:hypothetical protein
MLRKSAAHKESLQGTSYPRAVFSSRYEVAQEEREFRPGVAFL